MQTHTVTPQSKQTQIYSDKVKSIVIFRGVTNNINTA